MTEFIITAAVVIVLITLFLKCRKKCPSCSPCSPKEPPINTTQPPNQVKQQPELESVTQAVASVEPAVVQQTTAVALQTNDTPAPCTGCCNNSLPQDSVLRRHYLSHLITMIETVAPPRPTDSVLCRHHDAMLATRIEQCLNSNKAKEQLIADYENQLAG